MGLETYCKSIQTYAKVFLFEVSKMMQLIQITCSQSSNQSFQSLVAYGKKKNLMDFLQDFLFQLEDTPNLPGNSEESSSCVDTDNACASGGNVEDMAWCADTNSEGKDSRAASSGNVIGGCNENNGATEDPDGERPVVTDYTPAGIMRWLTRQKHKPLDRKPLKITMIFDDDCLIHILNHRITFPVIRACTKEVSFPVAHMETAENFNKTFLLALFKGQTVDRP